MDKKMFKYEGTNDEMFKRVCVDDYDADAVMIVPDTHYAVTVKDGRFQDVKDSGSYDLFDYKKGAFGKKTKVGSHTVDIIFMSKTYRLKVLWGTKQKFDLRDPISDVMIKVGACGEFTVQICEPKKAYERFVGTLKEYNADDLKEYLANELMVEIKSALANTMTERKLSYDRLSECSKEIGDNIKVLIARWFEKEYGLKLFNFLISSILISDEDKAKIEAELQRRKDEAIEKEKDIERKKEEERAEIKAREERELEKKEAREIAKELERLDDKQFERTLKLRELESKDYEKYLEVLKILGWESSAGKSVEKPSTGARFCTKCGHSYENGDAFCPGCGARVGSSKIKCPKCGKESKGDAAFCSGCGTKLN